VIGLGLVFLLIPSAAHALNVPALASVGHTKRHPSARWTLPSDVQAQVIEIATKPDAGSDGQFFSENVVVFDLLRETDTEWLDSDRLEPGSYFVHIKGWDNSCFRTDFRTECGAAWSNVLPLTITNISPQLTKLSITQRGHGAYGSRYYVTTSVRFRLCDDVDGNPTVLVKERKWIGRATFARASWSRQLNFSPPAGCATQTVTWRLADKFFGVGWYGFDLRIRDEDRALSNVIHRQWFTGD
jgi:hypothetical protein